MTSRASPKARTHTLSMPWQHHASQVSRWRLTQAMEMTCWPAYLAAVDKGNQKHVVHALWLICKSCWRIRKDGDDSAVHQDMQARLRAEA